MQQNAQRVSRLLGNAAEAFPGGARGVRPDVVTDQTSAHDPVKACRPADAAQWEDQRERDADSGAAARPR